MVTLKRATMQDAELIWRMRVAAFTGLLAKYQDLDTNPGTPPSTKCSGILRSRKPTFT